MKPATEPSRTALKKKLNALVATFDFEARVATDPVRFPRRYADPLDQEIVGLVAASLAFGNVVAIGKSVERVLSVLGPSPHASARRRERTLARALDGFRHRVYRGEDVARAVSRAGHLQRTHGSLGAFASAEIERHGFREGLAVVSDALRGPGTPSRGLQHLLADPRRGSACKRLLLFSRWMIRPNDGVDLGLWPTSPRELVIPVDTHVHRISKNLGLTNRKSADWRAAEEITATLRTFDPEDPVRYDFAICHLGVSRACPSRRDDTLCEGCSLRPVCRQWAEARS